MVFFSELSARVDSLRARLGADVLAERIPEATRALTDEEAVALLESATAAVRLLETVRISAAGVVAERSTLGHGHSGLAQKTGHRSPVALVQHIMGTSRGEAAQHVRLGEALLEGGRALDSAGSVGEESRRPEPARPWHSPLGDALLSGAVTRDQHDAIMRGLGEPPAATYDRAADAVADAWRCAAEQLIPEASGSTVEDLARAARQVRDALDPEGAARRFDERYERRSFRIWRDAEGAHHARIDFDDEMARLGADHHRQRPAAAARRSAVHRPGRARTSFPAGG